MLHRAAPFPLPSDCAGIFYRDGDLHFFTLTDGAAAQPEYAVFKGRVGKAMTEGEQNICFRGVVVAVADKYALRVTLVSRFAGEGKISRVAQPPGRSLPACRWG